MPKLSLMTEADWATREAEQAALFDGAAYGSPTHIQREWLEKFDAALAAKSEENLQRCIANHPYLAQYVTPSTGHHGIWIFPKQAIAVKKPSGSTGLIPDFLAVTRNSDGYQWWVLELKRADSQFSNKNGDALSPMANKAVVQCAGYLNHFDRYLDTIRSLTGVTEILRPKGVVLLIGDSRNESDVQRTVRSNLNESLAERMNVVSYDRIRRNLLNDLGMRKS